MVQHQHNNDENGIRSDGHIEDAKLKSHKSLRLF